MDLLKIGFLLLNIGLSFLAFRYALELITIFKIKIWLKKNKEILLKDEYILDKYKEIVLNSCEYKQIKELYDENLIFVKSFARIGLNYTDFLFFQNLIDEYEDKSISSADANKIFCKLKQLIWIIILFEANLFTKKIGLYVTKLSIVYFVVLFIYKKF